MAKKKISKKRVEKNEDRTLAIVTHLIGIFAYIFGAIIVFLLTKDKSVKKHARNALNWQISLAIYALMIIVASFLYVLIASFSLEITVVYPFTMIMSLFTILNIAFCIVAAVKANDGEYWKYPLSLNIIEKIDEEKIEKSKKELKKVYKKIRR